MKSFLFDYPPPAWLPDWRDESAYTDHGDDLDDWAWEFLRRNPAYWADYARWAALPDTEVAEDGESVWSCKFKINSGDWTDMKYFHADPPALPGETAGQYFDRTGELADLLSLHICRKWSIATPFPNPAGSLAPDLFEEVDIAPYALHSLPPEADIGPRSQWFAGWDERFYYAPSWPEEIDSDVRVFGFDLRLDLAAQLDAVATMLGEIKKERLAEDAVVPLERVTYSTPSPSKLLDILRVLDCVWTEGAENWRQLAVNKLYTGLDRPVSKGNSAAAADEWERFQDAGRKWADRALTDAQHLVATGYRTLLIRDAFNTQAGKPARKPKKTARKRGKTGR